MKLTRDQRRANLEIQMDWEEAKERGEPFEVEYQSFLTGSNRWCDLHNPTWGDIGIYRRKPEPPKQFRMYANHYPGGGDPVGMSHSTPEEARRHSRQGSSGTVLVTLPADELARLEREHGEMAEQIALIVNPTWNSMCGPKYLISESQFKAIKAIHERMTCDS